MDAQQAHDEEFLARLEKLDLKGSRQRLEALLKAEADGSSEPIIALDPISAAMARHPGLTRETAEEMAEAFGF